MPARRPTLFYWMALVLALACIGAVCIHHTRLASIADTGGVSLAWVFGIAAIACILLHEWWDSMFYSPRDSARPAARAESLQNAAVGQDNTKSP